MNKPSKEFDNEDFSQEETNEGFERDREKLINFLKYPENKRRFMEYLEQRYKKDEFEKVQRLINRKEHEHESELLGSTPYHTPGHIGPLVYQYLNMVGVEEAFASALQHTKSSITKTTQQRVNEINTVLRGVGGFNRQLKPSFTRNAVVYLEQEDPKYKHRDRIVFTVNLSDFELINPISEDLADIVTEDGRSQQRLSWDEAVNKLSEIISNTGMKPKYVRNDKISCTLVMKQDLIKANSKYPDEYFEFSLSRINNDGLNQLQEQYEKKLLSFDNEILILKDESEKLMIRSNKAKTRQIEDQIRELKDEKDFFIATNPDPDEMDEGYLFSIYVNTLKDYGVTKDKMQFIMTNFILSISNIAYDKSMDEQVNTTFSSKDKTKYNPEINEDSNKEENIEVIKLRKKAS